LGVEEVRGLGAVDAITGERTEEATPESRRHAASELIESHDAIFRRTARRYSICADDSEDAYQRALEILLTKAPPITGVSLVRWMQTVTKREALAVRRQRERLLSGRPPVDDEDEGRDPLDSIASDLPGPNDRAVRKERVARSGEALRTLKPQEVRALTLKAEGYSYAEIGEITGWTYTKINRCMAEGRKRFFEAFADIEQGRRCEELAATLSALADGEIRVDGAEEVHVHLRSCAVCRAKLRAFREIPHRVLELMPMGPALHYSVGGRPHDWLAEKGNTFLEKAREAGIGLLSRGAGDGTSQVAAAGGTRGAGVAVIAKVLAVCGATAVGGATCVATGIVDPGALSAAGEASSAIAETLPPAEEPVVSETPPPVIGSAEVPGEETAQATESAEATPAQQATKQFSFEANAGTPVQPAAGSEFGAPAAGGGGGGSSGSGAPPGGFGFEK
jgi:RNA polymerase sigma factor (sigma-70 family)